MGKIAVLDQQTIDKIAAGEVVERPASVVKELVENAVDAGASQITVEIRDGGSGMIRITDNGSGMEKDDIPLAFLRHSTSKIRNAEDLVGVRSLGFRGEALSSISAVAMVELITKTREQMLGSRCVVEGGVQKSLEEIGAPDGTTFIVRNLFYNTPARKKFLKSDVAEAAAVYEIMAHLALSHPEISFKVIIGGQMKLQTPGNGSLKDVIYHVYGRDVALRLIPVDRTEGPLRVCGFLGKPELSRGNRNYENYFVNGRFVRSKIVSKGIEDGYKTFMMQHRYPFVCLELQADGKLLDVNVHPTKMEIRFSSQNLVYDFLYRTVKDALSGKELIPEVELGTERPKHTAAPRPESSQNPAAGQPGLASSQKSPVPPEQAPVVRPGTASGQIPAAQLQKEETKSDRPPLEALWRTPEPAKEQPSPQDRNLEYFMSQMRRRVEERHMLKEDSGYAAPAGAGPVGEAPQNPAAGTAAQNPAEGAAVQFPTGASPQAPAAGAPSQPPEQMTLFDGKLLSKEAAVCHEIIGQIFDTYWLVQYGDKLYIIDQHAAHEKVLYERLMKSLKERRFQQQLLSPPVILNLSMQEEELFLKYRSSFSDMGFEIEDFGERAYAVRAVPSDLPGIGQGNILMELLDSLSDISGNISSESLLDRVATMSCKAAVKGNHRMSREEARALIDELLTLENPYNCPHGRPTIISMSKYELEKKFKRIV